MLRLVGLSFGHPDVDASRRAELSGPLDGARSHLRAAGHDLFVLTTCLRVELMWVGDAGSVPDMMRLVYGETEVADRGTLRHDYDAFHHLCRVAAGLDSPLVGEPEVLGQFRRAAAALQKSAPESHPLNRVLTSAVGAARSARKVLDDVPRGSLAAIAADRVRDRGRVAVLGAGAMARAAVDHLGDIDVAVFARRPGTVGPWATRPWDSAGEALAEFPAVISTVPGKTRLFSPELVSTSLGRRREQLTLVDLGMPPGFPTAPGDRRVDYLGVDDLASAMVQTSPLVAEERMSAEATSAWRRMTANDRIGAVIAALLDQADEAVAEEVRRFSTKLAASEDPESVLRQTAHTVARRVLHPAVAYLGTSDPEAVEVMAEAFGVSE